MVSVAAGVVAVAAGMVTMAVGMLAVPAGLNMCTYGNKHIPTSTACNSM